MTIKKIYYGIIARIRKVSIKYGKLFFYKININEYLSTLEGPVEDYQISEAQSIDDLKEIIDERGKFLRMYKRWLNDGIICLIAKKNNSVIGLIWLNNSRVVPLEFQYRHKLFSNKEAGAIDAYVVKKERGKGVFKSLTYSVFKRAQELGIETVYYYILSDNYVSLKANYRIGIRDVSKILYYIRLLWINIYYIRTFKEVKEIEY